MAFKNFEVIMIRVAIADDHPLVREGIKKVLQNEVDIDIIIDASDGAELLALLENKLPNIVITDITMPGLSGLDLIKDIHNRYPGLPILVLSIHPPDRFAVRTLKAGAKGYLCKSSISDELVKAIRHITIKKRKYISDEVAELLVRQVNHDGQALHETLSDREYEIMCMIANGKEVNEIANELSLSPHTVHTYRARIKEKMDMDSNVEMTRYVIENGLIN